MTVTDAAHRQCGTLLLSTKQAVAYLQGLQRSQGPHKRRDLARKALIAGELSAQHWLLSGTNGTGGKRGRLGKLTRMSVL